MKPPRYPLKAKDSIDISHYNVNGILKNIKRIKPKIHRFKCSCETHYMQIPFRAEDFEREFKKYYLKTRTSTYKQGYSFKLLGRQVDIFFDQKINRSFSPGLYLEVSDPTPHLLLILLEKFKLLNISSVEYTIDFFCSNPESVRKLYFLFKKYLVIKRVREYRGKKKIRNIHILEYDPNYNFTYKVNKKNKIYERGEDDDRIGKKWPFKKLNKLRFEFTADKYDLGKIFFKKDLNEFISNCKFEQLMIDRLNFMKFDPKKRQYPRESEDYQIGKIKKYHNCIMHYKHRKKVPFKHLVDSDGFGELKNNINQQIFEFIKEWQDEAVDFRQMMTEGK